MNTNTLIETKVPSSNQVKKYIPLKPHAAVKEAFEEAVKMAEDPDARLPASVMTIPTINCAQDKQTKVAQKIAQELFPHDLTDKGRKWSYVEYGKALSKVRRIYQEQRHQRLEAQKKEKYNLDLFHRSRLVGKEDDWLKVQYAEPGTPVKEPKPMPVNVPPLDDFKPFFCHMKNKSQRPKDQVEFKRGVFYADGRIDMCKQVVGPTWIGKLMESITKNEEVTHFLLGNNIIDQAGAEAISSFIRQHRQPIETWYLAGNCLSESGIRLIAEALQEDQHAKALWLKRNPLHQGIVHIAEMLTHNQNLEILDVDNVGMFDDGCVYLFQHLEKNRGLRLLYADANGIGIKGTEQIAQYFQYLKLNNKKGITSLWMGMNPLHDKGVIRMADALRGYEHLERLTLSAVRMTAQGLTYLLASLQGLPNLILLDVGLYKSTADMKEVSNNVGLEGGLALAMFIENNQTLKVLDMRSMHIPLEGLQAVAEAMEKNHTLLYVYPEQYGLKSSEAKDALKKIREACNRNCIAAGYEDLQDFCSNHLRVLKHTKRVEHIDSIYRNAM